MTTNFTGMVFSGLILKSSTLFAQRNLILVSEGNPSATIIISAGAPPYIRDAANDLQWHIKLSTGVTLPLVNDNETANIPKRHVKLAVGPSKYTEGKISASNLRFEEFWIKTMPAENEIFFIANDGPDNPATHFAISEFLERIMDAKWLWPGELGTIVTKKSTIVTPPIDYRWISPFDLRLIKRVVGKEVKTWFNHHRISRRRDFQENSNNAGWHDKYYELYPEMFARTPDGRAYTASWEKGNSKFRLDHPKYFELMVKDYETKGKPPIYTLYPNDGARFDAFLIPNADPLKVYRGHVPVTRAYLDFFQKFDKYVNTPTPVSSFDILAYSAYYEYPENYQFNGKNFNLWFVDKGGDSANWAKWAATGAAMYLRPNWWNHASLGPFITYKPNGAMFDYCKNNGMKGFKIDGFKDNWSLQGINYYVLVRQAYTSKTVDQIAKEYFDSFGPASAEVAEYFEQCVINSAKFDQAFIDDIAEDLDLKTTSISNVEALPGLYPAPLRLKLTSILNKAKDKVTGTDKQRLDWLKSGMEATNLVCDYVIEALESPQDIPGNEHLLKEIKEIELKYPYSITSKSVETLLLKRFKPQFKRNTVK